MSFGTAINCMDGRTQLPVNVYLKQQLEVEYIDTVTEPGPVRILAEEPESALAASILNRVRISTGKHGSQCVAIVAHHDCAGNPAAKDVQIRGNRLQNCFYRPGESAGKARGLDVRGPIDARHAQDVVIESNEIKILNGDKTDEQASSD